MAIEIVDLPSYKMVYLSIVFCMFTRGYLYIYRSIGSILVGGIGSTMVVHCQQKWAQRQKHRNISRLVQGWTS